nr:hypothetical protein [uncultured Noviherbaspirillum sp.]
MITSPASQENKGSQSGALADIIRLARLSRLTLLYHGPAATAGDAGRVQAAALASAATAVADGEVVVLFDAGSELAVPDLLAAIEAAVLEAAPQAPLAPPMAGPVEALAFWQQALGLRFLLVIQRFDLALARPDPEFDEVLLKLAHDPLEISLLLLMDEAAAPLLQRLKDALPELGETFLRLPDPEGASRPPRDEAAPPDAPLLQDAPASAPSPDDPAPMAAAPRFGPSPFLFEDPLEEASGHIVQPGKEAAETALPLPAQPEQRPPEASSEDQPEERRRIRRFSSLLEEAGTAPTPAMPPAQVHEDIFPTLAPPEPGPVPAAAPLDMDPVGAPPAFDAALQARPDGRSEPTLQATLPARPAAPAASAASAAGTRVYRERRPMQVAAWMQKRRSRRRRGTVGIASRVGSSSTVLFVLLAMLAVLGWQMPQLGASAGAAPAGAAARPAADRLPQAVALRGNR